jgi:hypothetical protein
MPVSSRARVAILVVAMTGLAACGGSSSGAPGSSGTAPSPSPSPSPLDAASARHIAVAAQIVAADLPGYKEDKTSAGNAPAPTASDKAAQACISGAAAPKYLADVNSSDFAKGASPIAQLTVSSETQVLASAAQGLAEFKTLQKPETLTCLNKALTATFAAEANGGTFTGKLVRVASTTPPGADGAARFDLDGAFHVQGVSVKLQAGLELILVGRAELTFNEISLGAQRLTDAERDRLATVLVKRAKEAQG